MYKSVILAASAIAGLAYAQSIPLCATGCITLPPECNANPECICNSQQWISDLSCCVSQNCSPEDQQAALDYGNTICRPVGATLPSQASCSGNASSTSSATGSATSSTSSATGGAASSLSSATASAASSASSVLSSASSSVSAAASSASSSASSAASEAASSATSAAFGNQVVVPAAGGVFGAIIGAVALL